MLEDNVIERSFNILRVSGYCKSVDKKLAPILDSLSDSILPSTLRFISWKFWTIFCQKALTNGTVQTTNPVQCFFLIVCCFQYQDERNKLFRTILVSRVIYWHHTNYTQQLSFLHLLCGVPQRLSQHCTLSSSQFSINQWGVPQGKNKKSRTGLGLCTALFIFALWYPT